MGNKSVPRIEFGVKEPGPAVGNNLDRDRIDYFLPLHRLINMI